MPVKKVELDIVTNGDAAGVKKVEAGVKDLAATARATDAQLGDFGKGLLQGAGQEAFSQGIDFLGGQITTLLDKADQLTDLSEKFAVPAEALQVIGNVAKVSGGSLDAVAAALNRSTLASAAAAEGNKATQQSFGDLGISLDEIIGKSPDEIFYRIADGVASSSDRTKAYAAVTEILGKSSGDLFATLEQGSATIRKLGNEMGVLSAKSIKGLADAKDTLERLQNTITIGLGNTVGFLSKQFDDLADDLQGLDQNQRDALDAVQDRQKKAVRAVKEVGDAAANSSAGFDAQSAASEAAAEAVIANQKEIRQAILAEQKAQAAAETLRLKPITDILAALDLELAKRKALRDQEAKDKAAAIVKPAADKIDDLTTKKNRAVDRSQNSIDPELRAENAALAAKLQSQIEAVTNDAQKQLQDLASTAAQIIGDSAAPNARAVTDTTQAAVDAQKPISEGVTGLQTAVAAIPPAVAPITAEIGKISAALNTAFGSILSALSIQSATISGLQKQIAAVAARIPRAAPGK